MLKLILQHIARGITLARNNPQIIYTLFLMVVIPLAFLASGQRFLQAATANQERLEKSGVGLMQDIFADVASEKLNDPAFLTRMIESLRTNNENITEFVVTRIEGGRPLVVAALDPSLVGKIDVENESVYADFGGMMKDKSVIIQNTSESGREWKAYRGIENASSTLIGHALTVVSMRNIDMVAMRGIWNAYLFLAVIILLIFVLLARQARIIDYTVLYRKLKEIDQMKDDFLSMAAHELRTPLAVIRGYVELLQGMKNLDEKNAENLRRIDISALHLSALIGDILDVARLEQGRMKFEFVDTDVNEAVKNMLSTFTVAAQDKGLALSCEAEPVLPKISVDQTRFGQILTNLIGNAIKYTKAGNVTVKAYFEPKKKQVSIRVSDTGIGISAEDQKGLFGKFYRVKGPETEGIQGSGLGLWITYKLITEMQGTITLESIKGKGSDFIISFPAIISASGEGKSENR